jgi:uncharacterized protein (TIGR03435 family)
MHRVSTILALSVLTLAAQTLEFDAASVKANHTGSGQSDVDRDGGLLRMVNVPLKLCISRAYGIPPAQILGPDWLDSEKYDITAKIAADDNEGHWDRRLQNLLADRFKLKLHRETKEMPVFALVVDKGGFKLKEDPEGSNADDMTSSRGQLSAKSVNMSRIVDFLGSPRASLDRPVVDASGLKGIYSFSLVWTPESPNGPPPDASAPPSLLVALQEQLGLRLVARKAPVPVLIVDSAEKVPTEN